MPTVRRNLTITEVSLCADPANSDARVALFKTADHEDFTRATFKTEGGKKFRASDFAFVPDQDKSSTWKLRLTNTPGGTPDRAVVGAAVAALGAGFRGNKVKLPAAARKAVKAKVRAAWLKANPSKTREDLPPVLKEADVHPKIDVSKLDFSGIEDEAVREALQASVTEIAEAASEIIETAEKAVSDKDEELAAKQTELDEAKKATEGNDGGDAKKKTVDKSNLSDAEKAQVEALEKSNEDMQKKADKDAERIAKLEDVELTREMTDLAKTFDSVTYETDELVSIFKSCDEDELGALKKLLTAVNEQIKTASLFAELGKGGTGGGDAYGQLQDLAKDLRKTETKLSQQQAFSKVYDANPDLAAQHKREQAEKRQQAH